MSGVLRFSFAYLAAAVLLDSVLRGEPGVRVLASMQGTVSAFRQTVSPVLVASIVVLGALLAAPLLRTRGRAVATAFLAVLLVQTAYSTIKADLPLVMPFHADPWLAGLDAALHGGTAPWELLHAVVPALPRGLADTIYFTSWVPVAVGLPLIVAATDADPVRSRQTMFLWAGIWPLLGNALALLGLSGGPVYHDRITGQDTFAALVPAMESSGIAGSGTGWIMDMLWTWHSEGAQVTGSGISAFPSMHVAAATLAALYLSERLPRLSALFVAWWAAILFLSVWYGWHYALDGYASALLVGAAWAVLRRRRLPARNVAAAAPA